MSTRHNHSQRGISLVELIVFIVIVSVALTGILLVMNVVTRGSADPLIRKQALAIAESLLEEVELMPFTFCDPDDANAANATSATVGAGACAVRIENIGPEAAYATQATNENRYSTSTPFDNVNDYDSFSMNSGNGGIRDITNAPISGLSGYSAGIAVAPQAFSGIAASDLNGAPQVLLITVTVTGPDRRAVVLHGIRTRYAPRAVP